MLHAGAAARLLQSPSHLPEQHAELSVSKIFCLLSASDQFVRYVCCTASRHYTSCQRKIQKKSRLLVSEQVLDLNGKRKKKH